MNNKYFLIGVIATTLLTAATAFAVTPATSNGLSHPGQASQLYLFQKDANWGIVDGGAWGKMMFKEESYVFNGHSLVSGTEYTLVNYCGWPDVQVMGTATADEYGDVHISGDMPAELCIESGNTGAKIWLVLSADLTGTHLNKWRPLQYLFEWSTI